MVETSADYPGRIKELLAKLNIKKYELTEIESDITGQHAYVLDIPTGKQFGGHVLSLKIVFLLLKGLSTIGLSDKFSELSGEKRGYLTLLLVN